MKKRAYQQNCSLAYSVDLLGGRWTLLIFRELLIQPCRFRELNVYLRGMGTNLLSARLKELEVAGLIEKQSSEVKREPYRLTPKGREIEPIALEFIRWGYRYGIGNEGFSHWDHWELLAMKAFFNPNKAESLLVAQFRCQALTAWVQVGPAGFCHGMGERDDANLVIASTITDFQKNYQMGKYESSAIAKSFASCFDLPQSEVHR